MSDVVKLTKLCLIPSLPKNVLGKKCQSYGKAGLPDLEEKNLLLFKGKGWNSD